MRCGDQRWKDQNFGFLEMSNFDIYVVESAFGAILGDPKFGSFHVGSPHLMAVTGHSWLTLVGNSNNEVCSPANNTVSKAFWQKKVLPEQRISYCEGIYYKFERSELYLQKEYFESLFWNWQRMKFTFVSLIARKLYLILVQKSNSDLVLV